MRAVGIEPTLLSEPDFESGASTSFTTPAQRPPARSKVETEGGSTLAPSAPVCNSLFCGAGKACVGGAGAYISAMASHRPPPLSPSLVILPPLYSGTALAIALASQYWGGLLPCILCLYQRWPHAAALAFGIAALLLFRVGATRWARLFTLSAGLALLVSAGIGAFHMGVEWRWWAGTASCGSTLGAGGSIEALRTALLETPVVRCDEAAWSFLGLSMAGYNFLLSGVVGLLVLWRAAQARA